MKDYRNLRITIEVGVIVLFALTIGVLALVGLLDLISAWRGNF